MFPFLPKLISEICNLLFFYLVGRLPRRETLNLKGRDF
jgi:hypothetical protein